MNWQFPLSSVYDPHRSLTNLPLIVYNEWRRITISNLRPLETGVAHNLRQLDMGATKAKNSLELSEYIASVLEIWYLIEQDQSNVIQSKLKFFFHFRVISNNRYHLKIK